MREYIICYDITEPHRLGRIYRELKKSALPMQHSVFLFRGTPEQLALCLERLAAIMNPDTDDIRAYPLPQRGLRLAMGPAALPGGVLWGQTASGGPTLVVGVNATEIGDDDEEEDDE